MKKQLIVRPAIMATVSAAVMWCCAARAAPIPKDMTREQLKQSILKNPATYDIRRSTWHAEMIKVAGKPPQDKNGNWVRYYRKELELPDNPEEAALTILGTIGFNLYINGELVIRQPFENMKWEGYNLKDLAGYFKKGRNVIAIETYGRPGYIETGVVEGMVRGKDGGITRILSDKTWKGHYEAGPRQPAVAGWEKADFKGNWPDVLAQGKADQLSHVGYGIDGIGGMLNPPYYGPIELGAADKRAYLIFKLAEPLRFSVKVYPQAEHGKYAIAWRLAEAETEKEVGSGVLKAEQPGDRAFNGTLEATAPAPGVYELFIELRSQDKILETRVDEVAVAGKIEQREVAGTNYLDGLDLELTDEVDCTDPNSPYWICSQTDKGEDVPAPIVTGKAGTYREAAPTKFAWFGVGVKLDKVTDPYLVEVEIPDDAERHMGIRPLQMNGANVRLSSLSAGSPVHAFPIGGAGIYTGMDQRLTDRMIVHRMIVFPKSPVFCLQAVTMQAGYKAAVRKVRIYRIKNDLPALKTASPDYRWTGQHLERLDLMVGRFYNGPDQFKFTAQCAIWHRGFYKDWYRTAVNMIKYMRFAGENLIMPGIYMYAPNNGKYWINRESANSLEILGRVLAANGMKLMVGVEYGVPAFTNAYSQMIDKEGRPAATWVNTANVFDPRVRADLKRFIADLGRLYGKNPGIAGIAMMVGGGLLPDTAYSTLTSPNVVDNPLDLGYDDITIGQFEKDTGIEIPEAGKQTTDAGRRTTAGDGQDPKRFGKRYEWLMANKKEQWIEWRNRKVHEIIAELKQAIVKANPAWKLAVVTMCPPGRLYSFDPALYQGDPAIAFGHRYTADLRRDSDQWPLLRQMAEDPELLRVSDGGAGMIANAFYEPNFYSKTWYLEGCLPCDHVPAAGRNFLRIYSKLLSYSTPWALGQTWNDGTILAGNEQERREFNRAFRVLPPGPYRTLTGNGLDKNLVLRLGPKGKKEAPFYVINPGAWPVEIALDCQPAKSVRVKDLVTGKTLVGKEETIGGSEKQISNTQYPIPLQAYEMRSLAIIGQGEITGAKVIPDPVVKAELVKVAQEKAEIYKQAAVVGEVNLARGLDYLGIAKPVQRVMAEVKEILAAAEAGDALTVVNMTDTYNSLRIEQFLESMKKYRADVRELTNGCYYVDCGATNSWIDLSGRTWLADQAWNGGAATWGAVGGNIVDRGKITLEGAAPGMAPIYQTERYAMKQYCFRLPRGAYKVRLHLMEAWCKKPGERMFNVAVQGKPVLEKFDIFKESGGTYKVLVKEFAADVIDEMLEIAFAPYTDSTLIDGIEVIKASP